MSKQDTEYEIIVSSLQGNLPSIPVVMNELMTVISDHDAALYALRDLLKMDHSIFAQLLKVANTHEHRQGQANRITGIDDAVQVLGLEKVKRIALNTTILTLYEGVDLPIEFSLESLWMHSVGVALASATLTGQLNLGMEDQAYTCGLLHDIGKVAKCKYDQMRFSKDLQSTWAKKIDCHQWETEGKHIRHDLLGSYLARSWGISSMVETVTKWHHEEDRTKRYDIEDGEIQKLVDIVYLANGTIHRLGFGNSGHKVSKPPSKLILRRLRMDEKDFEDFEEKLSQNLEKEAENLALFQPA
ncbi:MAG: HDOD domain-containing protein [Opitutae bacterium]|jgi:HD-like signal output (HDOD) protein|nr:HDOD domain-containing protein [Opitutae bacterium]